MNIRITVKKCNALNCGWFTMNKFCGEHPKTFNDVEDEK